MIPSGVASERPGELLGSTEMQRFLERLKKITDVIILDCAPLVVASDVVPLIPQADGVIIVARARKTRQELARSTAALLERMGATTAGVVLNDAREFSIPLAKRRMYRPTRKMRKAVRRSGPLRTEEPSTLAPFVEAAPVVEEVPIGAHATSQPVEEPQHQVRRFSAGSGNGDDGSRQSGNGDDGSRQSEMLVAERMVQIPAVEEVQEQPPARTPAALQSLEDELLELRAQLEGLQLELPDVGADPA